MPTHPASPDPSRVHPADERPGDSFGPGESICPSCGGSGLLDGAPCPECNGSGRLAPPTHES